MNEYLVKALKAFFAAIVKKGDVAGAAGKVYGLLGGDPADLKDDAEVEEKAGEKTDESGGDRG